MNERYRVYSTYLKETYGEKVYKLPISIPDTCPNRDGTLGVRGCAFCGSIGAGYENLPATVTIGQQIEQNMAHIKPKYKANKFIAYFQNFTNTYLPPERFRDYLIAACQPDIVALAVATRPDCLNETYLDIMADVKEKYGVDILVELGLQTVNYKTLAKINRRPYGGRIHRCHGHAPGVSFPDLYARHPRPALGHHGRHRRDSQNHRRPRL